jgi:hypothetical protein
MRVFIASAIFLFAGTLLVSSVSKIRSRAHFHAFARAVAGMGLVTGRRARPAAAAVVAGEIAVTAMLLWPPTALAGLAASAVLFGGFTIVLALAVRRDAGVSCHCFGASRSPVARRHVVRAGLLCAVAAGALAGTVFSPAAPITGIEAWQALIAVAVAAAGVAALVWLDELAWLFGSRGPV